MKNPTKETQENTYPDEYCDRCHGEGVDADPWGFFDGTHIKKCPHCYTKPNPENPLEGDDEESNK